MILQSVQDALNVVNWCLQSEDEDFWNWVRSDLNLHTDKIDITKISLNHVYAIALRAVGIQVVSNHSNRVYHVGTAIVDQDAAADVCDYYDNPDEEDDYERNCLDNGEDSRSSLVSSTHVYAAARRALGRKPDLKLISSD